MLSVQYKISSIEYSMSLVIMRHNLRRLVAAVSSILGMERGISVVDSTLLFCYISFMPE
jgi:hypothetical protein